MVEDEDKDDDDVVVVVGGPTSTHMTHSGSPPPILFRGCINGVPHLLHPSASIFHPFSSR